MFDKIRRMFYMMEGLHAGRQLFGIEADKVFLQHIRRLAGIGYGLDEHVKIIIFFFSTHCNILSMK